MEARGLRATLTSGTTSVTCRGLKVQRETQDSVVPEGILGKTATQVLRDRLGLLDAQAPQRELKALVV